MYEQTGILGAGKQSKGIDGLLKKAMQDSRIEEIIRKKKTPVSEQEEISEEEISPGKELFYKVDKIDSPGEYIFGLDGRAAPHEEDTIKREDISPIYQTEHVRFNSFSISKCIRERFPDSFLMYLSLGRWRSKIKKAYNWDYYNIGKYSDASYPDYIILGSEACEFSSADPPGAWDITLKDKGMPEIVSNRPQTKPSEKDGYLQIVTNLNFGSVPWDVGITYLGDNPGKIILSVIDLINSEKQRLDEVLYLWKKK